MTGRLSDDPTIGRAYVSTHRRTNPSTCRRINCSTVSLVDALQCLAVEVPTNRPVFTSYHRRVDTSTFPHFHLQMCCHANTSAHRPEGRHGQDHTGAFSCRRGREAWHLDPDRRPRPPGIGLQMG